MTVQTLIARLRDAEKVYAEKPEACSGCDEKDTELRRVLFLLGPHFYCRRCYYQMEVAYGLRIPEPRTGKRRHRKQPSPHG